MEPEYDSIESFAQHLMDDELDEFSHVDLVALTRSTGRQSSPVRQELESYGFTLKARPHAQHIRTFGTSSNDRWYGPGSSPTHGGGGGDCILGFADAG